MTERGMEYLNGPTKRRLDLLGGLALGAAVSPIAAAVAVASALDTGRINPLFRQNRIGRREGHFDVYKFRTINPGDTTTVKVNGPFDARASQFGRAVRSLGLDEIPQVANVVAGDMSLVGIRPMLEPEFNRMQDVEPVLFADWHDAYLGSRPGLTGPGQLHRHHYPQQTDDVYRESMRLDLDYAESATLRHDLEILTMTPKSMLKATLENRAGIRRAPQSPSTHLTVDQTEAGRV